MIQITSVRIDINPDPRDKSFLARATIVIDGCFAVEDLSVVSGSRGLFVSMPHRKRVDRCPECKGVNHLRAIYCNECGYELEEADVETINDRPIYFDDVAHPTNSFTRQYIQETVLRAYHEAVQRRLDEMQVRRV